MSHDAPAIYLHKGEVIKMLVLDVDGILTDGSLYFDGTGEILKCFNVQDGLGLQLLNRAGVKLAAISSKVSAPVEYRLQTLGFDEIHLNIENKLHCFNQLLDKHKLDAEHVCYMGDDFPDLPLISKAGLGITVPDAHEAVKQAADCVTEKTGGRGAVREVCDYLLEAKDQLDNIVKAYQNQGYWPGP